MTAGLPSVRTLAQAASPGPGATMNTLSTFMSAARARPLPEDVAEQAKYHLLDTLAAIVSGCGPPWLGGVQAVMWPTPATRAVTIDICADATIG